jgi:tetratricopeptide (TPR) repeat protein
VVLDDADAFDEPPPIEHVPAVVGVASRGVLAWPGLAKLQTADRLVVLQAQQLAFTEAEARSLFRDDERARRAWMETGGWPLALHLFAITGQSAVDRALAAGIRESLGIKAWRAALLLAAVPYLPEGHADESVRLLVQAGFARRLEGGGYRIHEFVAETLRRESAVALRNVVRRHASRLPGWIRAEAYLRAGMHDHLRKLLDSPESVDFAYQQPEWVLRWDEALGPSASPWRRLAVAMALCYLGRLSQGLALLETVAAEAEGTHPDAALRALGELAYHGASVDLTRALRAVERGEALVGRVTPRDAAGFYNRAAWARAVAGQHLLSKASLERALALLPADDPEAVYPVRLNLAVIRFELEGDLEDLVRSYQESLEHARGRRPSNVPLAYFDLGRCLLLLGERGEALECFRKAAEGRGVNFWAGTLAAAWHACLVGNTAAFPKLVSLSESSQDPALLDWVRGLWARALRETGRPREALDVLGAHRGFWTSLERALALRALGHHHRAAKALPPKPRMREELLYWHACRFRVLRRRADLSAVLRLTTVGARVLPALVPLPELPTGDPELARWYPIEEVVRCGRRQFLLPRLHEVPPLEVRLLGCFEVLRAGEPVRLSETARSLVTLLALRLDRDALCEALWPESPPSRARNRLNVHMHHLRRALEPWGVPTFLGPHGLTRARVDLWDLQDALDRGDAEAVFRVYREPVAPGVDLPAVDEFRWQLQSKVASLLYRAALRDEEHAAVYLDRVVELAPWHAAAAEALSRRSGRASASPAHRARDD